MVRDAWMMGFEDFVNRLGALARRSLLTGIFTGIYQENGPQWPFWIDFSLVFSVGCAPKSLLDGTGIS
jgi:hypothetical protein